MRLSIALVAAIASLPAIAAADEPLGFGLDVAVGGGVYTGAVGEHSNRAAPQLRLGAGVTRGPWALLLSVEMPSVFAMQEAMSAAQPVPPAMDFIGFGIGPSVRRELTRGDGLRFHVRVGYTRRWLHGDSEVKRTCQVNGGCAGGFWVENPSYSADGPTIAIGVSGRTSQGFHNGSWFGIGVELAAGHMVVDRLGHDPDLGGTFVSLGLNLAIGRGNR